MLVMFVLIYIAVSVLGMDRSPYLTLSENHIICEITYTDGTTRKNLVPDQWRMSRGDVLRARIKLFYIRANRCSSLYNDIFALRGWKTEEINGIQFELNSILVEKWEGKMIDKGLIERQ